MGRTGKRRSAPTAATTTASEGERDIAVAGPVTDHRQAGETAARRAGTGLAVGSPVRIWMIAVLSLPALGMTCGPSAEPPPPDDCGSPGDQPIASLAIGPERLVDQPFQPWAADDTAYITQGAQGGNMLGVSLSLAGQPAPACLAQQSEVHRGDELLSAEDVPINTYDEAGDGQRTTHTLWLVFDGAVPDLGDELDVITEAGGKSAAAHVQVVANRHRLVSLTPAAPDQYQWHKVHFTLTSLHAPDAEPFEVELSTAGDPGVLQLPATTATIFNTSEELVVDTTATGTAELVVRLADQEVRAAVNVITY